MNTGVVDLSQEMPPILDCGKDPYVPVGLKLSPENHRVGGKVPFDINHFSVWAPTQDRGSLTGVQVLELVKGRAVANALAIEFFLKNRERVSPAWDGKFFALGTLYEAHKSKYARYMTVGKPFGFSLNHMCLDLYWGGDYYVLFYKP